MSKSSVRASKRSLSTQQSNNLLFQVVDRKLVWLDFAKKLVQFIDLDLLKGSVSHPVKHSMSDQDQPTLRWSKAHCRGFTVREVLQGISPEDFRNRGVTIDEVAESSVLRMKMPDESGEDELTLMQLTAGSNATVYNLQPDNRYEVALLMDMSVFRNNPLSFSNTGFVYNKNSTSL